MNYANKIKNILYIFILLVVASCVQNKFEDSQVDANLLDEELTENSQNLESLIIPNNFDFATEKTISVTINDLTDGVKYTFYSYDETTFSSETLVQSGITRNGGLSFNISVPTDIETIKLMRYGNEIYEEIIPVLEGDIQYTHTNN